jgi:hypothetical protein
VSKCKEGIGAVIVAEIDDCRTVVRHGAGRSKSMAGMAISAPVKNYG